MAVVVFFRLILAFLVVRLANADEEACRVDRKADLGLAEYKPGAQNLRTDYDVQSADDCFQRCCNYTDSASNRCNAASYYKVAERYPVCVLLDCNPFSSCVWKPATNFTAARIKSHPAQAAVQSFDTVSQVAMLNQSAVTSPQGPVNPVTTQQQQQQQQMPSGNPVEQAWNANNDNGAAVENPAQPFNQPDQPFNQADQPFNQAVQPFNQADQPFNQADQPFNQADQPFNQADQPFNQQDQPSNQQDQPFNQPNQPFNQQDQPFNQPEQSVNQPEQPVNQPNQPFNQPEQNVNQPEQNVNQPEQPVNQPNQPFNQPEQNVNQPEQNVNQPEQNVNQPEQNVNQPFNFNDPLVSVDDAGGWPEDNEQTASSSSAQNPDQTPTSEDAGPSRVRPLLNQSPGIIIGLCSALGVSFLVLVAICRKIYQAGDKPKYKPLRDYDIRFEPPVASSALLP